MELGEPEKKKQTKMKGGLGGTIFLVIIIFLSNLVLKLIEYVMPGGSPLILDCYFVVILY